NQGYEDVYVSLRGRDSDDCGTLIQPCKSIAKAVQRVDIGGYIYLNGTGTERKPYDCGLSVVSNHQSGIIVQKSLTIEGFKSRSYVSCVNGFHFVKTDSRPLGIFLSGIVFQKTPLTFQDSDNLTISSCSFKESFTAVSVYAKSNSVIRINIDGFSSFENNTSCLDVIWRNPSQVGDRAIFIDMKHIMFTGNGLGKQLARGLVTIKSELEQPPRLHVQISCLHVTATKNHGYFVNLNLSEAVTSEMYTDVVLVNNTVTEPSSGGKRYDTSKESQVEIQNSSFIELQIPNERGGAIFFNSTLRGSLTLFNNMFYRIIAKGGGALFAHNQTNRAGTYNLIASFKEIRAHDCYGYKNICDSVSLMLRNGKVVIEDSSWRNNNWSVGGTLSVINTGGNTDLIISGCTFFHNAVNAQEITVVAHKRKAGNVTIANSEMLSQDTGKSRAVIVNTIFITRKTSDDLFGLHFFILPLKIIHRPDVIVDLDNVTFASSPCNLLAFLFSGNKSIRIKRSQFTNCFCSNKWGWVGITSSYSAYTFSAGAISIFSGLCNGNTTFKRCRFNNNFAAEQSGHVYLAYGTGKADFIDCIFNSSGENLKLNKTTFRKSAFVKSDSGGPIGLKNTTMSSFYPQSCSAYPVFDISSGGYVYMDDNSTIQCPIGSMLVLDNATHFVQDDYNKCLPCPFGAICVKRNIVAKRNYWGRLNSLSVPPSLTFIACPEHYCRQPGPGTNDYNMQLCSHQCRKDEECENYWFWVLTFLLTIVLSLYLLRKPPTLSFLLYKIIWFRRKESPQEDSTFHEADHNADNAYIKITFYFYQVAEILMVSSKESLLQTVPGISAVIAVFNFKLRALNKGLGCPFPGLTSVTKQLVLSGTVFLTMADVALVYFVHCVINIIRRNQKPSLIHYMAVTMEVLLLGYERLAETCFKLMTCVSIGSEMRLFIDANVTCMQWWQYLVLACIAVFIVPFIVVLYLGSSKLYKGSMKETEFLAACVLPLPFLVYWLLKKTEKRPGNESLAVQAVNKDVMEVLHGPFRPPKSDDKGTLYWESVLIGRRFILLACHSFITSPMLRMIAMATACSLIALHHVLKYPFRNVIANRVETLSLTALLIISIINLTKATLISFGITVIGPYGSFLDVMEWFEVGVLGIVPVLVSVLVISAILSQLLRVLLFLFEQAGRLCHRSGNT
ncbi:unnamed protein product, partial [Pocillopora meandrina]